MGYKWIEDCICSRLRMVNAISFDGKWKRSVFHIDAFAMCDYIERCMQTIKIIRLTEVSNYAIQTWKNSLSISLIKSESLLIIFSINFSFHIQFSFHILDSFKIFTKLVFFPSQPTLGSRFFVCLHKFFFCLHFFSIFFCQRVCVIFVEIKQTTGKWKVNSLFALFTSCHSFELATVFFSLSVQCAKSS